MEQEKQNQEVQVLDLDAIRTQAIVDDLQRQRAFMGDRAANHAGDIAVLQAKLELSEGRVRALEQKVTELEQNGDGGPNPDPSGTR